MNISNILSIILLSLLFSTGMTSQEENDPKATRLLDKARIKFESLSSYSFNFQITNHNQGKATPQKGTYIAKKNKYAIDLGNIQAFSDGEAAYVLRNNKKDIEIYDLDKDSQSLDLLEGPSSILNIYNTGTFLYQLVDHNNYGETKILFKPVDRESEIVKITLILTSNNNVKSCQIFMRDASNMLLKIINFKPNVDVDTSIFKFDESNYPGANIEDLRL